MKVSTLRLHSGAQLAAEAALESLKCVLYFRWRGFSLKHRVLVKWLVPPVDVMWAPWWIGSSPEKTQGELGLQFILAFRRAG